MTKSIRAYDTMNRVTAETTPDSGTMTWAYDENSNVRAITDAAGAATTNSYDAVNRRIASVNGIGATRAFAYTLRNDLAAFTDAKGQTTTFEYDVLGWRGGNCPTTRTANTPTATTGATTSPP